MSDQGELFGDAILQAARHGARPWPDGEPRRRQPPPLVRPSDPETSHQAARAAAQTAANLRERCYAALAAAGADGLTDFELGAAVGRQQTSAGKRRGELVVAGRVVWAETHRLAPSGSPARVWRAR